VNIPEHASKNAAASSAVLYSNIVAQITKVFVRPIELVPAGNTSGNIQLDGSSLTIDAFFFGS